MVYEQRPRNGESLDDVEVAELVERFVCGVDMGGRDILVIVPDNTRTAPVGQLFRHLHERLREGGSRAARLDVMIALGTHPPMDEEAILRRMEWTAEERDGRYRDVEVMNHSWDRPETLVRLGVISRDEIGELSGGLFAMDVGVDVNRRILDYDLLLIAGPVFPHEVVGFSGGNKYFFPGVSGPELLNFFHWLGAVVTNPMIIGNKWTPVRKVVDRAARFISVEKYAFCFVVDGDRYHGVFAGKPEEAWDLASDLSARVHIEYKDRPFHTVLSCAPPMYDELWVAGKCMYKLESVVADGGELIIHAPHLAGISEVHGGLIRRVGYHCRDYFLQQWDRFKDLPWGVLAHSTHVHGIGGFDGRSETRRIMVTLASRIPPETCREINLGYRDPDTIDPGDYRGREDEGILLVPKAGEKLYQLKKRPEWAGGVS